MLGWLVNNCLTCIPGTKTFWHDLLDNINSLEDKTDGFTAYPVLADKVEASLKSVRPDYIIRNATYFRKIQTDVSQISFLQDVMIDKNMQFDVCNNSTVTVFNSPYTASFYKNIKSRTETIPIGVDFDFFKPNKTNKYDADVIYIGSSQQHPKGFDKVLNLINQSKFTFNLVMKDDFKINNLRVRVFNKIPHSLLVEVINSSRVAICTSQVETLHLAGVECGACDVPIVTSDVGIYFGLKDGQWGLNRNDVFSGVNECLTNLNRFSPRKFWIERGLDKKTGMQRWNSLISNITQR